MEDQWPISSTCHWWSFRCSERSARHVSGWMEIKLFASQSGTERTKVELLYDEQSRKGPLDIIRDRTQDEREMLGKEAPKLGLQVPSRGGLSKGVAQKSCHSCQGNKTIILEKWLLMNAY